MAREESDERTEDATPRRIEQAHREGSFPASRSLSAAIVLVVLVAVLALRGRAMLGGLLAYLRRSLAEATTAGVGTGLFRAAVLEAALALALPMLAVLLASVLAGFLQSGGRSFSLPRRRRGLEMLSALRLLDGRLLVEAAGALLKIALLLSVAFWTVRDWLPWLVRLPSSRGGVILHALGAMITQLAVRCAIAAIAIGVADYLVRWMLHRRAMRMSQREVRRELKEQEGDPLLKELRRHMHRALSAAPDWDSLGQAAVLILIAPGAAGVALGYERFGLNAPVVLVRVSGHDLGRLETMARAHALPILVHPALVDALAHVQEGREIPRETYPAVASLLAGVAADDRSVSKRSDRALG
jgi:flagellar biosynthetic protein FlhB